MSEHDFYVVWNPQGRTPTYKHSTEELARTEAERLARNNPGQQFYVMAPLGLARRVDVEYKQLNQLPF